MTRSPPLFKIPVDNEDIKGIEPFLIAPAISFILGFRLAAGSLFQNVNLFERLPFFYAGCTFFRLLRYASQTKSGE